MGATIPQQFGDAFEYNVFGVVTGTVSATQLFIPPTGTVGLIRFKAHPSNVNLFTLGDGIHQTFWLSAGDDTGWVSLINPNQIWYSDPSGTMDYMAYWLQR